MDMTPYLQRSLTNAELMAREGLRYEGRIVGVVPQQVFNQWKFTKDEVVPVISFADGYHWIPNVGARRALTEAWGADTDLWIGRWLRIYLKAVARTEKTSGRAVEKLEKHVTVLDEDTEF
jgi:hypothetical protein